jgi:hypothetical protein
MDRLHPHLARRPVVETSNVEVRAVLAISLEREKHSLNLRT